MVSIPPAPDDWYTVYVHTPDRTLDVGAIVKFKDYEFDLLDGGVLRLVLQDRSTVYLFAPGQWSRIEAKPAPEGVEGQ